MSARDRYHEEFKTALENEGWAVTDDPLTVQLGSIPVQIDMGAERLITADKGSERIAVEVKTFRHPSFITDMYQAVGQYICYHFILKRKGSDRKLYLGMPTDTYLEYEEEPLMEIFDEYKIPLILYDYENENIDKWITQPNTKR